MLGKPSGSHPNRETPKLKVVLTEDQTVGDLAADWTWQESYSGFTLAAGTPVWEHARFSRTMKTVVLERIVPLLGGIVHVERRYVKPETPVKSFVQ